MEPDLSNGESSQISGNTLEIKALVLYNKKRGIGDRV